MKTRTSIFEMLLNELLIGKTIYEDNGTDTIVVDKVRFHPKTSTVYAISSTGETVTFFIDDTIDIEMANDVPGVIDISKIKRLTNKDRS